MALRRARAGPELGSRMDDARERGRVQGNGDGHTSGVSLRKGAWLGPVFAGQAALARVEGAPTAQQRLYFWPEPQGHGTFLGQARRPFEA